MRFKYIKVVNFFLIFVLSLVTMMIVMLNQEKSNLEEMFAGSKYALISYLGTDIPAYQNVLHDLDQVDGIDVYDSYPSSYYDNVSIGMIDKSFQRDYIRPDDVTGNLIPDEEFTRLYQVDDVIPVIMTSSFAKTNNFEVGDELSFNHPYPSNCMMFPASSSSINYLNDGTSLENNEQGQKECRPSSGFQTDGVPTLKAEVIGIYNDEFGLPSIFNDYKVDLFMPNLARDEASTLSFIDADGYIQGDKTFRDLELLLMIDYEKFSQEDINNLVKSIQSKYGIDFSIDYQAVNDSYLIQDQIDVIKQRLVSFLFITMLMVVIFIVAYYYFIIDSVYMLSVYNLLGIKTKVVLKDMFKANYGYICLTTMGITLMLFINIHLAVYMTAWLLLMMLFDFVVTYIIFKYIVFKDCNDILIKGELWLN